LHSTGGGDKELFAQLSNFLIVTWYMPVALLYSSHLLGFLTVLAFYGMIGFSVVATGLCYFIGFRSKDALERACVTSVVLVTVFSGVCRSGPRDHDYDVAYWVACTALRGL
jgi:hypothetical protein